MTGGAAGVRRPYVRRLARGARTALDLLLPPACVSCAAGLEPGEPPLCGTCRARLPAVELPRCRRCGATRLGEFTAADRCAECESWPESLVRAASPWRMEGVAARVVHALKYEGWTALAPWMGRTMAGPARRLAGEAEPLLVPVPLAPARRRERGFNQAEALAAGLAADTGWPVLRLLRRTRSSRQQARLGRPGRAENVRGLFAVAEPVARSPSGYSAGRPEGTDAVRDIVLLVDDVLTTGATAAACAAAISAAGYEFGGVISFARALRRIDAG